MNLLKRVGEYFLGTEIHKWYAQQRSFCREYVTHPERFKETMASLRNGEILYLGLGKVFPNLLNLGAIACMALGVPLKENDGTGYSSAFYLAAIPVAEIVRWSVNTAYKAEQLYRKDKNVMRKAFNGLEDIVNKTDAE